MSETPSSGQVELAPVGLFHCVDGKWVQAEFAPDELIPLYSGATVQRLLVQRDELLRAMREIQTICTESAGACRKRMGTRVGNALVTAKAAIVAVEGKQ